MGVWVLRLLRHSCRAALLAPLFLLVGGPRSVALIPIVPELPQIVSAPVTLDPDNPALTRVGRLVLLGGWRLDAPRSRQFGGWSALRIESDRFTMVGDYGSILRFRLTRFGRAVDARIDPIPLGCGRMAEKSERDSESLARADDGWWIGFEFANRLCKVTPDFTGTRTVRVPAAMRNWRDTYGAETLLRLADGRFVAISERGKNHKAPRPVLVFSGDPADPATRVAERRFVAPTGYAPVDAAQLPDGHILVLTRRFELSRRFTTIVVLVDPAALDRDAPIAGIPIARLEPPTLHDNFEGIEVTTENGRPVVWLVSDDNFMAWQATYLLKFALDGA